MAKKVKSKSHKEEMGAAKQKSKPVRAKPKSML